jgi:hypothetical protein
MKILTLLFSVLLTTTIAFAQSESSSSSAPTTDGTAPTNASTSKTTIKKKKKKTRQYGDIKKGEVPIASPPPKRPRDWQPLPASPANNPPDQP